MEEILYAGLFVLGSFSILFAIVYVCKTYLFQSSIKSPIHTPDDIPDVKWPFLNLLDENGKKINMLCVRAYLDTDEHKNKLLEFVDKDIKLVGCSSNQSFPRKCDNPHGNCNITDMKINDKYIEEYVLGWCHCFREPEKYIRGNIPKILLSESDFNSEDLEFKVMEKKYDYIAVQPKDNDQCEIKWTGYYKNWPLAEKCIKVLSDELNLKGLIVGRDSCPVNIKNQENIETTGFLDYGIFLDKIRQSKFMLLPNLEEASPRILTESLSMNVPVFVNEQILGGWKYVNDDTGVFFNESNIKEQALLLLNNYDNYKPRDYYINNHGIKHSGKQFRDFLKSIYPDLSPCKYVKFNVS